MPKVGMAPVRRRQVIEAVVDVLEDQGWEGLTIREVASKAGVSSGIVAHYFGDKQTMVVAAIKDAYSEFLKDLIASVAREPRPAAKLRTLIERITPPSPSTVPEWTFWIAVWGKIPFDDSVRTSLRSLYNDYARFVAGIMQAAQADTELNLSRDPDLTARQFIAFADGLVLHCSLNPETLPPDRMRDLLCDFLSERGVNLDA